MSTTLFIIILGIVIGAFAGLINVFLSKDSSKKISDGEFASFSMLLFMIIFTFFIILPVGIPSKEKEINKIIDKTEYTLLESPEGLIIKYQDCFAIIDDYETVNNFNEDTEITLIIERAFYGIELDKNLIINNKTFKLK